MASQEMVLPTDPPMNITDVLDVCDGVYFCVKDHQSTMLWCNSNFANLVGQTKEEIIGVTDPRKEHVQHDVAVMASNEPLLNLHETIDVPVGDGKMDKLQIVTQKGLLRKKGGNDVIGITVNFSKRYVKPVDYWIKKLSLFSIDIGGYFSPKSQKQTEGVLDAALPERFVGDRRFYSSGYYLLSKPNVLRLHSLNQDELWFYHYGGSIRLHIFHPCGKYESIVIGEDDELSANVPHGTWFGGELLGLDYCLTSCSLAPGFDARDSKLLVDPFEIESLIKQFPEQASVITILTK